MKHWTIRILLMLTLGAVTTVAVALLAMVLPGHSTHSYGLVDPDTLALTGGAGRIQPALYRDMVQWGRNQRDRFVPAEGNDLHYTIRAGRVGSMWAEQVAVHAWGIEEPQNARGSKAFPDVGFAHLRYRVGWPCKVASANKRTTGIPRNPSPVFRVHVSLLSGESGRVILDGSRPSATLPASPLPLDTLRPIFPGFIINTLFYAAIWFGLFFGFSALRRTIRRKRGRCPRCGYDLRGNVTNGQDARSTSQDARSTGCPECGWNRGD